MNAIGGNPYECALCGVDIDPSRVIVDERYPLCLDCYSGHMFPYHRHGQHFVDILQMRDRLHAEYERGMALAYGGASLTPVEQTELWNDYCTDLPVLDECDSEPRIYKAWVGCAETESAV